MQAEPGGRDELLPLPSVVVHDNAGNAAGSLLKIILLSENVTVPVGQGKC
jgi:hypothetical protein